MATQMGFNYPRTCSTMVTSPSPRPVVYC